MRSAAFGSFINELMKRELLADSLYAMLVNNYFPNAKHSKRSDIGAEVVGKGYQSGGKELTGRGIREDANTKCPVFYADDLIWPDSTITANGVIIYKPKGNPGKDELVAFVSLGAGDKSENGDFKLTWNKTGILLMRWGLV